MIYLLWLAVFLAAQPVVLAEGLACTYDPGEMERVAEMRNISLAGYRGGVALREREHLGKTVYIRLPDGWIDGPFKVVDYWCAPPWCPDGADPPRGWACDVDWNTWARWIRYRTTTGGAPLPGIAVLRYAEPQAREFRLPGWTGLKEEVR